MRSAGNFHPEWGYLAPAPSFMRTVRTLLVASAVGATAGAAVILSLAEHPGEEIAKTSVSSPVLVTTIQAAVPVPSDIAATPAVAVTPVSKPALASMPAAADAKLETSAAPPRSEAAAPAVSDASTASTPDAPANVAALAEAPPADVVPPQVTDEVTTAPDQPPTHKKMAKKHRNTFDTLHAEMGGDARRRWADGGAGFAPFLRKLFSARAGTWRDQD